MRLRKRRRIFGGLSLGRREKGEREQFLKGALRKASQASSPAQEKRKKVICEKKKEKRGERGKKALGQ